MSEAFKCQFAGINSNPGDECQDAFLWFILFNFISTISNILMFLIIQEGSAVLFIIIRTLKTPITSYLASFPQLAGISASPVTVADWYAFVMLIVASLVYYYKDERDKYRRPITNTNNEIEPILVQENNNLVLEVDDLTPLSLHSQFSTLYNNTLEDEKNVGL